MKRLLSRRSKLQSRSQFLEPLEERRHLSAARVTSVTADNRGEVILTVNAALNASTVTKSSVQAYTAGADGVQGTTDDVHLPASVRYSSTLNRITIEAQVAANVGYRIRLVSPRISDTTGQHLDGEFNGTGQSGNGVAGGIYEFQTQNDKSATPTAKAYTSAGTLSLRLFRSLKPISVANFLAYANSGDYDGIFITRSYANNFVEQGGSLKVNASNQVVTTPIRAAIANEFSTNGVIHNTAYTLSFAKLGGDPNSATNQFFINQVDNSSNLDNQNGGFTVFATAANTSSEATIRAIGAKTTVAITSPDAATDTTQVPVNSTYNGTLNPATDLVVFRRVALMVQPVKV